MSHIKHEIEMRDQQRDVAIEILVKAGVLWQCPIHDWIFYDRGGEIEDAYRFGNARFTEQHANYDYEMEIFETRRDLTDAIKETYEELYALDECPLCAKD